MEIESEHQATMTGLRRRVRAYVSRSALEHNYRSVAAHVYPAQILAVVKSDAYGHGLLECATIFAEQGAALLGVAFVEEGIILREAGITTPILVMTPVLPDDIPSLLHYDLQPIIDSISFLERLGGATERQGTSIDAHLCIDTGMSREGVFRANLPSIIDMLHKYKRVHLIGLMTHFATSDEPDNSFLEEQLYEFDLCRLFLEAENFNFTYIHAANSAAIYREASTHYTLVRPGLALYGYVVGNDAASAELIPALRLETQVASLRRVEAGTTVSYGRRYTTQYPTTIATLPIGYADGWLRSLSGKASCLIKGRRFPIVGTICMDLCMVDIGDADVQVGDTATLIGPDDGGACGEARYHNSISLVEVASQAGTIPYEILVGFMSRIPRKYTD